MKKNINPVMAALVLATAIVVGSIVYYWQSTIINKIIDEDENRILVIQGQVDLLNKKISDLNDQIKGKDLLVSEAKKCNINSTPKFQIKISKAKYKIGERIKYQIKNISKSPYYPDDSIEKFMGNGEWKKMRLNRGCPCFSQCSMSAPRSLEPGQQIEESWDQTEYWCDQKENIEPVSAGIYRIVVETSGSDKNQNNSTCQEFEIIP